MPVGKRFGDRQVQEIQRVLHTARQVTGLRFSVWVGEVQGESRGYARRLHAALGRDAPSAVLVAVDPAARWLEIVTGVDARRRLDDRTCAQVAASMTRSFATGDLAGGITSGISMLTNYASQTPTGDRGRPSQTPTGPTGPTGDRGHSSQTPTGDRGHSSGLYNPQ